MKREFNAVLGLKALLPHASLRRKHTHWQHAGALTDREFSGKLICVRSINTGLATREERHREKPQTTCSQLYDRCNRADRGDGHRARHRATEGNASLRVLVRCSTPRQVDHSERCERKGGNSGRVLSDQAPKGKRAVRLGNNDRIITDPSYWGPFVAALDPGRTPDIAI